MKKLKKSLLFIISLSFIIVLLPQFVYAFESTSEKMLGQLITTSFIVFLLIYILIYGIIFLIFFQKDETNFKISRFITSLILVIISGLVVSLISISLGNLGNMFLITPFVALILIGGLDFLICKNYLKADSKKSIYFGLWMGILTNPILFVIIYLIIGKILYH